jgi:hypothetical protein
MTLHAPSKVIDTVKEIKRCIHSLRRRFMRAGVLGRALYQCQSDNCLLAVVRDASAL